MTDHKTYNEETIKHLLERFMDGDTTLEEEQLLAQFFRQTHIVPSEWQPYKQMFAYFDSGMKPADLASEESEEKTTKRPTLPRQWIAAAAVAVLLVGACLALWLNRPAPERKQIADRQLPGNTLPQPKATDLKNHHEESNSTTTLTAFATENQAKKQTKPQAKRKRKARKRHDKTTEEPTDIISSEPFHIAKLLSPETDSVADDSFREAYTAAVMKQNILLLKDEYIRTMLQESGFVPVIQENGTVTYTQETDTADNNSLNNI
ncbi:MAG: hypothetical protein J5506_08665 [Prevotella sp.]|nr:hypothetical protein [Prevotella sp.]